DDVWDAAEAALPERIADDRGGNGRSIAHVVRAGQHAAGHRAHAEDRKELAADQDAVDWLRLAPAGREIEALDARAGDRTVEHRRMLANLIPDAVRPGR